MELANHRNGCKHTSLGLEPCQATPALKQWTQRLAPATLAKVLETPSNCCGKEGCGQGAAAGSGSTAAVGSQCVVWRAGEALTAGQEVCYGYHAAMLQDMALLQYGFLQVIGGKGAVRRLVCGPESLPDMGYDVLSAAQTSVMVLPSCADC